MIRRVLYSPRSQRDLEGICGWIAAQSKDPAVATKFAIELLNACDSLKTLPERFATYPHARRWRMMPVDNYLVFFQVHEDEVRIGHIRHGTRRPFAG